MATADGRMADDYLSYGCGPGAFIENAGITSILNSTANLDHESCACGNPLTISFCRKDIAGQKGNEVLRQVIEAYFKAGGFHLHINIVDAASLKEAQKTPEEYRQLIVRVSGYSAYFTSLSERWQKALIERTELGM